MRSFPRDTRVKRIFSATAEFLVIPHYTVAFCVILFPSLFPGVKFSRIPDPASPSWDPAPLYGTEVGRYRLPWNWDPAPNTYWNYIVYWNTSTTWNDRLM